MLIDKNTEPSGENAAGREKALKQNNTQTVYDQMMKLDEDEIEEPIDNTQD